jgi:hypothetical protein
MKDGFVRWMLVSQVSGVVVGAGATWLVRTTGGDVIRRDDPHDEAEFDGECTMVDGVVRLVPKGPFNSPNPFLKGNLVPIPWGDLVAPSRHPMACLTACSTRSTLSAIDPGSVAPAASRWPPPPNLLAS